MRVRRRQGRARTYLARQRSRSGLDRVFTARPQSGCSFPWQAAEQLFIDPCHGSAYKLNGEYVRSPSQRGLDRFRVDVAGNGTLTLDPSTFEPGPPAP